MRKIGTKAIPEWERPAHDHIAVEMNAITGRLPEAMRRAAPINASTFDADEMTVEAIASTFADVPRRDAKGPYIERLDPAGLDTSNLPGRPLLDGHRQGSARDVLGIVQSSRMESGNLIVRLRLSTAEDAAPAIIRIREAMLSLSVAYRVFRWADSIDPNTKSRVRTAAAWQIFEVSAVPVPADPGATFRSDPMSTESDTIETPEVMPDAQQQQIRNLAEVAGFTRGWAEDRIDENMTLDDARAAARDALQTRSRATPRIRVVDAGPSPVETRSARTEALAVRMNGGTPSDAARPYMGETLRDMARACVEAAGISTRSMDADELFRAAMHTTSDFPQLLTGAGNRTLVAAYQAAQSPLKALARSTTMTDFRTGTRLKLSDIGLLEKVSESGEIKSTTRGEAAESYALDTYGTMFSLSRKALINDDLGAFRDWGATAGRMAAETEANLLHKLLVSNPTMGEDSKALFHSGHGNLASAGSALDVAALSAARLAMRGVKALDKKTPINATPKYLLVGPQLETTAEQVLASIYAATVATANPFTGKLELLVEPRITDKAFYVFADPAALPVLEYAYLSSAPGPQMASREGWGVLGVEYRVVLDFGAGAIDWRGAYRNPGV